MSIVLNGSTQYAYILEALKAGRPVTVVGWFKSDSDSAGQAVASLADKDNDVNYRLLAVAGDLGGDPVQVYEQDSSPASATVNTSTGYTVGTWHHAIGEFIAADSRKVLIDNGSEGVDTDSVSPTDLDKTAIGVICRSTLAWFFSGKLAEIAIWGAILSDPQKADLAAGRDPFIIDPTNLLAYYSLWDNANDGSGNNKHLTTAGSPTFDTADHPPMRNIFISSAAGVSGASGFLNVATSLVGSITGVSGASGSLNVDTKLVGSTTGVFGASGSLEVAIQLISSTVGITGANGSLSFLPAEIIGSATGVSGASGSLDTQPELGSSIVEITGASGSLGSIEVATQLVGSAAGVSGADGSLNVEISLVGEVVDGTSAISAVCVLRALWGFAVGISGVGGYLSIVPDFNASTLFWRPQNDIVETLEWKTSILKANDGTEQRIKVRQSPRQHFKLEFVFPTNKLNTWYDSIIHTWQKLTWLIPVWSEYVEHLTDINRKEMTITVDTTNADFRDNSKAMVWKSSTEYEILVIDSKTDSQLNLSYSLLSSFSGDKYIIPVRTAYLISSSKKERYNSEVSVVSLVFAVYDNIDQLEDYAAVNYDGYEILDVPSFMGNSHLESSDGDIFIADFKTGIFKVESDSNFNFLSQNHSFFNDTKKACWDFRKFLYSLDGRQKVVLIPTFRSDVVQTDNIAALDTSVKIENIGLAENMGFNSLRTYIGFYFPATGILTIRKITAITELDSSEEQIDFNTDLGLLVESGDCKIGFVDKCRLASDKVEIRWPQAHKNECQTNFMRVP